VDRRKPELSGDLAFTHAVTSYITPGSTWKVTLSDGPCHAAARPVTSSDRVPPYASSSVTVSVSTPPRPSNPILVPFSKPTTLISGAAKDSGASKIMQAHAVSNAIFFFISNSPI
jgi:hypothetical protein